MQGNSIVNKIADPKINPCLPYIFSTVLVIKNISIKKYFYNILSVPLFQEEHLCGLSKDNLESLHKNEEFFFSSSEFRVTKASFELEK